MYKMKLFYYKSYVASADKLKTAKTYFEYEILDCWWCESWRFRKLEKKKESININLETKKIIKEIEIISN